MKQKLCDRELEPRVFELVCCLIRHKLEVVKNNGACRPQLQHAHAKLPLKNMEPTGAQTGSSGLQYMDRGASAVEKRKMVVERNVSPGLSVVLGKLS